MRSIHRWMAIVGFVVVFCGMAAVAVYYANEWWLSGVMSVSITCWLAGVLAAVYGARERRPLLVGALVAGFLYVLLALGPWFRTSVGPWLLTTRGLAAIEQHLLGREPAPTQFQIWESPPAPYAIVGSGIVHGDLIWSLPALPNSLPSVSYHGPSLMVTVGHWLFGWIAAGIGSLAAMWIVRRQRQGETSSKSAPKIHAPLEPTPAEEAA